MIKQKLSRQHIAFYKSLVHGLDEEKSWNRYLRFEGAYDGRSAKAYIRKLRNDLITLCLRHNKSAQANALKRFANLIANDKESNEAPQFDENFYSESELIALYAEHEKNNKKPTALARKARLIDRQIKLLDELSRLAETLPHLNDQIIGWLPQHIALALADMKIHTLNELVTVIQNIGKYWYRRIPKIGKTKAEAILEWLHANQLALGVSSYNPPVLVSGTSEVYPDFQKNRLVAFEYFQPPGHIDGREGKNRGLRNKLDVDNDYQAIQAFLFVRAKNPNTARAYKKEAERLLLWCVLERGIALSDMNALDCEAYQRFLLAPYSEKFNWINPKTVSRKSVQWRPFAAPLSKRSAMTAITILSSMFAWLTNQRYLDSNPWLGINTKAENSDKPDDVNELWNHEDVSGRAFTVNQWHHIQYHLKSLTRGDERDDRLNYIVIFLAATGLRASEFVSLTPGHIRAFELKTQSGVGHEVLIKGKGAKVRIVPIPEPAMQALQQYLQHRPNIKTDEPILVALDHKTNKDTNRVGAIKANWLNQILKEFFRDVANRLERLGHVHDANKIRQGSAHWLRHTNGTLAANAGVPISILQKNMGHSSPETTSIYINTERERRYLAMRQVFQ